MGLANRQKRFSAGDLRSVFAHRPARSRAVPTAETKNQQRNWLERPQRKRPDRCNATDASRLVNRRIVWTKGETGPGAGWCAGCSRKRDGRHRKALAGRKCTMTTKGSPSVRGLLETGQRLFYSTKYSTMGSPITAHCGVALAVSLTYNPCSAVKMAKT